MDRVGQKHTTKQMFASFTEGLDGAQCVSFIAPRNLRELVARINLVQRLSLLPVQSNHGKPKEQVVLKRGKVLPPWKL